MINAILNLDLSAALQTTLAVSLLICLVMLIRQPVARRFGGRAAYALWAIPLVRLVMPPLPSGWSVFGVFETAAPAPATAIPVPAYPAAEMVFTPSPPAEFTALSHAPVEAAMASHPAFLDGSATHSASLFANLDWGALALSVWVIGVVVMLGLMVMRQRRFDRVVEAEREPASPALQSLSDEVARTIKLRRAPKVATSLISSGPLVTGLTRPLVLMPSWFEIDYSRSEQLAALTHELTHVKRRDLWTLQLAQVFLALQWFNPLAHLAMRAFRSDQEAACDADVLACGAMTPHAYGSTLMKVVRRSALPRSSALAASLPLTHAIKERLILMQRPTPSAKSRFAGTALTGLIGAFALFMTAGSVANADDKKTSSLSIGEDTFIIDGREIEDRRFVLLTNPMEDMEGRFEQFGEIGDMVAKMDFSRLEALEDMGELEAIIELGALTGLDEAISKLDLGIEVTEGADGSMTIVIPKTEIRLDKMLADTEAWAEELEAKAAVFEEEMEAWGAEFEAAFDDEFGDDIAARTGAVSALAEECEKVKFLNKKPVILERKLNGNTFKAICVEGDETALNSDELRIFVKNNSDLSRDEIKAFLKNRSGQSSYHFSFEHDEHEDDQSVE